MSPMIPLLITVSLLLRFLGASTTDEQRLHGDLLSTAAKYHMRASSMQIKGSESLNSIALQADIQNSFFVDGLYTDAKCTSILFAEVFALNICTFSGSEYFIARANTTTFTKSMFSDALCKTPLLTEGVEIIKYTDGECTANKEKHYVQSTAKVTSASTIITTK